MQAMYRYKLRDKDQLEEGRVSLGIEEHLRDKPVLCDFVSFLRIQAVDIVGLVMIPYGAREAERNDGLLDRQGSMLGCYHELSVD